MARAARSALEGSKHLELARTLPLQQPPFKRRIGTERLRVTFRFVRRQTRRRQKLLAFCEDCNKNVQFKLNASKFRPPIVMWAAN